MGELPAESVTFLFTDIEGSTRLWERHPEAMRDALSRHEAMLREAIEGRGGVLFKTLGDQCCAAFGVAADALAAAMDGQLTLLAQSWEEIGALRVRMALHSGPAEAHAGDYFGSALNRVARLLPAGHGGQILLSQATYELAQRALPDQACLQDLGSHRLKDLQQPEQIFQLVHPSLPSNFPPLRSLEAFSHNLPRQLSSFIGREKEMAEVKELLVEQGVSLPGGSGRQTRSLPHPPLLTLTGAGGCGKTRLALQVAADLVDVFADGVWLVELAPLADASLVVQTVASSLGVREEQGRPLPQTLCDYLRSRSLLLLLDNCEHLLAACAELVTSLLRDCPGLRVLATSRQRLGLTGERTYRVPSLSLPDPKEWLGVDGRWLKGTGGIVPHQPGSPTAPLGAPPGECGHGATAGPVEATINQQVSALLEYEAVRLFVERAHQDQTDFTVTAANAGALVQLCAHLDGIPFAIELAAARARTMPVEQIAARLADRFRLLTGGSRTALPRQQTLQALIDWSYDLLSPPEQVLLRRLSVFAGSWTLEAAEAVGAGEGVERSALSVENSASASMLNAQRSTLLVEKWQVLDSLTSLVEKSLVIYDPRGSEARYRLLETVRQYGWDRLIEAREAEHVRRAHVDCFVSWVQKIEGMRRGVTEEVWLDLVDSEHDNLRAALDECCRDEDRAQAGLGLAAGIGRFWAVRGFVAEGRERLSAILNAPGAAARTTARARALFWAARLAKLHDEYATSRSLFEEGLGICRELGDQKGVADLLNGLGPVLRTQNDPAAARAHHEEARAICRELSDSEGFALSSYHLGFLAFYSGDTALARFYHEEALALRRQLGNRIEIAFSLMCLGNVAQKEGDNSVARRHYEEALALLREIKDAFGVGHALYSLATTVLPEGDYALARSCCDESLRIFWMLRNREGVAYALETLARGLALQEQWRRAASMWGAAAALREAIGIAISPIDTHAAPWAAARAVLGEEAFAAAWAEGHTMPLEQVVAEALDR